jgi:hypothetical protein
MTGDCQTHQLDLMSFWQEYVGKITRRGVLGRSFSLWVMESSLGLLYTTLLGTFQ